jgi:nucleoside-diphosphate-sugar epimerase
LLVDELVRTDNAVVAISRNQKDTASGSSVEYRTADAMDEQQLREAIAGCPTVYSVLGLLYVTSVWEQLWVPMTEHVLGAVRSTGARLVFLDNVYPYGVVDGTMTEEAHYRPVSRKGRVRANAARMLLQSMARGDVPVLIARSADFIGPGAVASVVGTRFFKGVVGASSPKRRVEWLGDPRTRHCYGFTLSLARALALLGYADDTAYGQTWHLPACGPLTGYELCKTLGEVCNCTVTPRTLGGPMLRLAGLFNADAREQVEMQYQVTHDYLFSDDKFRSRYPDFPTDTMNNVLEASLQYFSGRSGAP